ncbi:MAG: antibiotic biosynthesis monooxygenase family protein [Myxococcota bacterium]
MAISRFVVQNGMEDEVRAAFENRPRGVESVPAFLGFEVLQSGPTFILLTRWSDEDAFQAWHRSPKHREAHALIPRGLKLDPAQTQLIVGETIEGATSGGDAGGLMLEAFLPMAQMVRGGQSLHVAILDEDGDIVRENGAFQETLGIDVIGRRWGSLLAPESRRNAATEPDGRDDDSTLVHMVNASGEPVSLFIFMRSLAQGHVIVGEPPWDDHQELTEQLTSMNAELAVLSRENARQARLLEEANRNLREAHWHLEKIAQVLPICMSCHAVKTADDTWEDVASFLLEHSDFLSHGYCDRCAEEKLASLDDEGS